MSVRARWFTALELVFFVLWSGAFVWLVLPLNRPPLILLNAAALFGFTLASHLIRGKTLGSLGLGRANFMGALRLLLLPTVAAILGAVPLGYFLGTTDSEELGRDWFFGLLTYPFWGLFQQYVFQGYIYNRVAEAGGGRRWPAIVIAASLYSLVHFPNELLLVLCLPIGIVWAWVYSRRPNLYALGLSHGLLGATMKEFVKNIYWAGMRVGPSLM